MPHPLPARSATAPDRCLHRDIRRFAPMLVGKHIGSEPGIALWFAVRQDGELRRDRRAALDHLRPAGARAAGHGPPAGTMSSQPAKLSG